MLRLHVLLCALVAHCATYGPVRLAQFSETFKPFVALGEPHRPSVPGWDDRILVGRSSQRVGGNSAVVNETGGLKQSNGADVDAGSQSDRSAALKSIWEKGHEVRCGENNVTLRIRERLLPHLTLDCAGSGPVPVTKLQRDCGFQFKRTKRDTEMVAPFHGCHEMQQDGYTLPLSFMKIPYPVTCPGGDADPPFPPYPYYFPPFPYPVPHPPARTPAPPPPFYYPPFFFPFWNKPPKPSPPPKTPRVPPPLEQFPWFYLGPS